MLSKAPPTGLIGLMRTCGHADASDILIKVYLTASLISTAVFSFADMFTQGFFKQSISLLTAAENNLQCPMLIFH